MQPVEGQPPPPQPQPPFPESYPAPYPLQYPPPYYALPPPPRKDHLVLIIVLVVVLVVLLPIIAAAVLYVMVSGLIGPPVAQPMVVFGSVIQQAGNATVPVAYVSQNIDSGSLLMLLQGNYSAASAVGLPPPGGGYRLVVTGAFVFRVYWIDADQNGLLSSGDSFRVTGDNTTLPASTALSFTLRSSNGPDFSSVTWTTP